MKSFLSYSKFLKENYLPYFGVKQALDDSKNYLENTSEAKTSDFHRIYSMTATWWNLWYTQNKEKYEINQDALSKTYIVTKDGKTIFIFDYNRNKIFTNEKPEFFVTEEPTHKEYIIAKDKKVEDPNAKPEEEKKPKKEEKEDEKPA